MKKSIISGLLVLITVHVFSAAQCRAEDYVTFGFYADALHTTNCAYANPPTAIPIYFYMLISPVGDGVGALEMSIEQSSYNIIVTTPEFTDIVGATIGSIPGDIAISFIDCCEVGWFHVFTVQVIVMNQFPEYLAIGPWTGWTFPRVADCTIPYELWDVLEYYDVFINTPGCGTVIGTKESTWGAIKDMYK